MLSKTYTIKLFIQAQQMHIYKIHTCAHFQYTCTIHYCIETNYLSY